MASNTPPSAQVNRQPLKLILVPTDFSPGAEPALRWAATIAEPTGAEIALLHVLDFMTPAMAAGSPDMGVWLDDAMIQEAQRRAETAIAQQAARLPRARTVIREGTPRLEILEVAKELQVDLIVMGTHGRTGIAHMLIGSVAEHIVRHSPIAVLTVRQQNTP